MCGRFRERCGLYQLQKQHESDKDQKKCKIEYGKFENIPTYPVRIVPGVLTECYKACKGRDQRADAADVDPDQKIGIVVRELREKNRRWHIAYDLTREGAEHKCVLSSNAEKKSRTASIRPMLPANMKKNTNVASSG